MLCTLVPFCLVGPCHQSTFLTLMMGVTDLGLGFHALILELVDGDILLVGLKDYGFGAYVKFTFLFDVLLLGYGINVAAQAREVTYVCLVFFKVVEGEAPRLG